MYTYIYIYICMYICIYLNIHILYAERERDTHTSYRTEWEVASRLANTLPDKTKA